jgi:hypothetical protein
MTTTSLRGSPFVVRPIDEGLATAVRSERLRR